MSCPMSASRYARSDGRVGRFPCHEMAGSAEPLMKSTVRRRQVVLYHLRRPGSSARAEISSTAGLWVASDEFRRHCSDSGLYLG